ncbi:MAG: hypothetical protein GTO51_04430 [Candidatus Latescibacteria bacterium]|nr:hypothetical protein [Candidatus Latescibacterota bacterium]NIM21088.1 hypothetical protein [Candidatus Latescibacterota bacterium]NIM65223.1 hypothetical protein [Candidatus Latescibacterota bacterium]NIO01738.1 hypothetical protein [Candidatus Latescibacterota bacterium]NIO28255.1 hypothetical protein [Candidatus Latescibacterota bacterium]
MNRTVRVRNSALEGRNAIIFIPLALIYLLLGFNTGLSIYDEGLCVYGAVRVLDGDLPYRDFWTIYAPGQFYVLAGLFKLFGAYLIVERIWSAIVALSIVFLTYLLSKSFVHQTYALLAALMALIWLGSGRYFAIPMHPALLFSLLGTYFVIRYLFEARNMWLFLAGISVGITTVLRHDFGFYSFVSIVLIIIGLNVSGEVKASTTLDKSSRTFKSVVPFLAGLTVVLIPTSILLVSAVPVNDLRYDLISFPLTVFPKVRALPYPAPIPNPLFVLSGQISFVPYAKEIFYRAPFYASISIYAAALISLRSQIRRRGTAADRKKVWGVIIFLVTSIVLHHNARVRTDTLHLVPALVMASILFSMLLSEISRMRKYRGVCWFLAFLFCFFALSRPVWRTLQRATRIGSSTSSLSVRLDRFWGMRWDPEEIDYLKAIDFVRANVPKNQKLFVGNVRHDRIFVNDILFYFLSERHSATKYHELHPGLATTERIQQEIIGDLDSHNVGIIVLRYEDKIEPDDSGVSSGVTDLDLHIRENYNLIQRFGDYSIWKRKTVVTSNWLPLLKRTISRMKEDPAGSSVSLPPVKHIEGYQAIWRRQLLLLNLSNHPVWQLKVDMDLPINRKEVVGRASNLRIC